MNPPNAWAHLPFFETDWPIIKARLESLAFLPGPKKIFRALDIVPPEGVRVVILGQDPYPTPGHADGLAFSVTPETDLPRSLKNIFKEMQDDIQAIPKTGDLSHWAQQGVLLLNTSLSVMPGAAAVHARWGWDRLARQAVTEAQRHNPVAFILWGNHAQKALAGLPRSDDLVITSAHPSPLSARRGFFGSRPFSQVNNWLVSHKNTSVDWAGNDQMPGDYPAA